MSHIPYRQIHLDFHTSEYIPSVGAKFDKEEFGEELAKAHVNSITCFARCHHGWLYYPSQNFPELIHPNLQNKNLLPEQIEAGHKRNIKVPIYTTVQWDGRIMREHPQWLSVDEEGKYIDTQHVPQPHFYYTICLNSGYRKFFREHVRDIVESIGAERVDGIFMDILFQVDCCCENCQKKMKELGMDMRSKKERLTYSLRMLDEFKEEITAFIHEMVPGASVFYNSSHVGPAYKDGFKDYSHLELESLPSGGWGYDHFPATSRYARTLGKEMIGMTGKFHTYWGDFHSLKNEAALELECFQMLAMGAGCSIGDQLHPNGVLSKGAYDVIGHIYESVEKKEAYCQDAVSVAEIGVLNPEEFYQGDEYNLGISPSLIGTMRMLQELSYQFDIIDSGADFSRYSLILLPDCIYYRREVKAKLEHYISKGGKILGSYDSCLEKDGKESIYGISYKKESPFDREFVMPNAVIGKQLPKEEMVMYLKGYDVNVISAEVLMDKIEPYFNREGKTFCSHQHGPSSGKKGAAEVTRKGNCIYFAHPIFHAYRKNAARWCKEMVKDALEILLPQKMISHNGPSTMVAVLNRQKMQMRDVLHILHYITEKKSEDIYTVEDIIPLYHIRFEVFTGSREIKRVIAVPEQQEIAFTKRVDSIEFELGKIDGHAMILIE